MIAITDAVLDQLEEVQREALEAEIVTLLAERLNLPADQALQLYFSSRLAQQIDEGACGIQYLDAHYLAEDLLLNEPELVASTAVPVS